MSRIILALLTLSFLTASCSQITPSVVDTIGEYEAMRAKTEQAHSHIEYCDNDIIKLTISSRGELAIRDIYVPRKAVVHFRNRDSLNTYPLGVRIAENCLAKGAKTDCHVNSKIWGINVGKIGGSKKLLQSYFDFNEMEPTDQKRYGLFISRTSESAKGDAQKWHIHDLVYTNFSPFDLSEIDTIRPSLRISFDSHPLYRQFLKRCKWFITTNEGIRTSRASHCEDLSEWKTYLSEFDALSDIISKSGKFAQDCKP